MKWRGLILTVVLASVIAACADPAGAPDSSQSGDTASLGANSTSTGIDGSWILVVGAPIVDGFPITLNLEGDRFSGTAACNGYGGEAIASGGTWVMSGLAHTEMACESAVMDSESQYLKVFADVTSWSIVDGMLEMTGTSGELVFTSDQPADAASIVGLTWILETLSEADMAWTPVGNKALLRLNDDGTLEGSTGCRTLSGRWIESGAEISFPDFAAEGACDAAVVGQDRFVVAVLAGGFRPTVEGRLLTIEATDNRALVYRASVDGHHQVHAADVPSVELASVCGFVELGESQDPVLPDAPLSKRAQAALEPYMARTDGEFGFFAQFEWFLHNDGETEILLFGLPLMDGAEGYADARLELIDGVWEATGWGTCHPKVSLAGSAMDWGLATWILDPATPPDGLSSQVPVLIRERSCANGEPPSDREIQAQTRRDGDGLIITVLVEPIMGMATCPGNPWYRTLIDIGEAPGDRTLLDGSETPAEERSWPPEHPDYFGDEG